MTPDGSGKRLLARGDSFEWSPDGQWIAFDRGDGLYVRGVATQVPLG